jgi:hypothetical protein
MAAMAGQTTTIALSPGMLLATVIGLALIALFVWALLSWLQVLPRRRRAP